MQENKNLILAVVLCLIVLFGWGHFAEYMGWVKPMSPPVEQASNEAPPVQERPAPIPATPVITPSPGHNLTVETPLFNATFYTGGGTLRSFVLKKYQAEITPGSPLVNLVDENTAQVGPLGLVINNQPSWSAGHWTMETDTDSISVPNGQGSFTLLGSLDSLGIRREFTIDAATYLIRENVTLTNNGAAGRNVRVAYTQAMDKSVSSGGQYDSLILAWDNNGKLDDASTKTLETTGLQTTGKIYWAGPMTTYFLSAIVPSDAENLTLRGRAQSTVYRTSLEEAEFSLAPGQSVSMNVGYWMGPKDRDQMEAVSEQLTRSINLGFFSIIGKGLIWLLELFHQYVHNWGVAIILLTVFIKIIFWPLTGKSYVSMEKMKELQPMMLKIREQYKDNREQMNKEVMNLYKTYKVNPMGGCLPILIQLPVFFGLYQALMASIALRHASFITYLPGTHVLWLADLSSKDPLYITPVIMGITMFLQQKMSPAPADPMQAKIMMFLPLIFTVLFLNFPSGLVIYWLANNVLTIFQQWWTMRKLKRRKQRKQQATS